MHDDERRRIELAITLLGIVLAPAGWTAAAPALLRALTLLAEDTGPTLRAVRAGGTTGGDWLWVVAITTGARLAEALRARPARRGHGADRYPRC